MIDLNVTADRIVRQDVHLCLSVMVSTLANGAHTVPHVDRHDTDLFDLAQQAFELCSPVLDYEEAARQAGWALDAALGGDVWTHAGAKAGDFEPQHSCYGTAESVCDGEGLDPYEWDVFEHWAVSSWLAEKLTAAGERVDTDFAGLNVWARTTTGQAISMDAVIQRIAADVEACR